MSVLRIDSSARTENSNSRALTQYLTEQLGQQTVARDLSAKPLPPISAEDLIDLHASNRSNRDSLKQHFALSEQLITELKAADTLVIGTPMHNFNVPVVLKQWIDYICRAGETFRYTANGPEGLSGIGQAFIVTATGGTPIGGDMDYASRYLEQICRFIGVAQVTHIDASGSKRTPELVIARGKQQIDEALAKTGQISAGLT